MESQPPEGRAFAGPGRRVVRSSTAHVIAPGEHVEEPCTLPAGVMPRRRRMLPTALGLEIPPPSRTSLLGFLAGWLGVAALICGFAWLVMW